MPTEYERGYNNGYRAGLRKARGDKKGRMRQIVWECLRCGKKGIVVPVKGEERKRIAIAHEGAKCRGLVEKWSERYSTKSGRRRGTRRVRVWSGAPRLVALRGARSHSAFALELRQRQGFGGVTGQMVRRWETGTYPTTLYRTKLDALLDEASSSDARFTPVAEPQVIGSADHDRSSSSPLIPPPVRETDA